LSGQISKTALDKSNKISSKSVQSHLTCEIETKDTDIKEYESMDIHGVRNNRHQGEVTKHPLDILCWLDIN
jgi:hypothetical protein